MHTITMESRTRNFRSAMTLLLFCAVMACGPQSLAQQEPPPLPYAHASANDEYWYTTASGDVPHLLAELQESIKQLYERVDKLLTNDDGKRLAQDPITLSRMVALTTYHPVRLSERNQIARRIESIVDLHQNYFAAETWEGVEDTDPMRINVYAPMTTKEKAEVQDAQFWAREQVVRIKALSGWLDGALKKAPNTVPADAPTLEAGIAASLGEQGGAFLDAMANRLQRDYFDVNKEPNKKVLQQTISNMQKEIVELHKAVAQLRAEMTRIENTVNAHHEKTSARNEEEDPGVSEK